MIHPPEPLDSLASYHYFRDDKVMADITGSGQFRLIGDSGAYSAMTQGAVIDIGAYADWITRWRGKLCWAASLDVIGEPRKSLHNWRILRDRYGVDTVPSIHTGSDYSWLDAYGKDGVDLVGIGGLAMKGRAVRCFGWTLGLFRYARDRYPDMRFHLWGVLFMRLLANLPAWSVDSTGAVGQAQRFGWLRAFDPDRGVRHQVSIHDPHAVRRIAPLVQRTVGIDVTALDPRKTTSPDWYRFEVAETRLYAAWLQRRHSVTAPLMSDGGTGPTGTRLHIASGPTMLRQIGVALAQKPERP